MDKNGTKENEREGTDRFEDCHKVLQSTPIFYIKVTMNNLRPPAFFTCTYPNRSQKGLFKG